MTQQLTQQPTTGKEMGLIKTLSKRNYELTNTKKQMEDIHTNAMKHLYKYGKLDAIWEYMDDIKLWGMASKPSEIFEYENKKGHKSMGHRNANGKYYGSCKKYGDKPILIPTGCYINREDFEYYPETNRFIFKVKEIKPSKKKIIKKRKTEEEE
tara:strand:- start:571 stop:1032 length:462 start_codon:yes stop_codon:yes gene_type:complete